MHTLPRTLDISTGTSRGRETYGYTIVRLRDSDTGKVYRCMGGGYDMVGTVLADWLVDTHQDALGAISDQAYYRHDNGDRIRPDGLYGMTTRADGSVTVDGACGVRSVEDIAKAAGVRLASLPALPRGGTHGWLVVENAEGGA